MSLEDLGNIGELVAAIGVIISLVYLALQIRQNTKIVRLQFRQALDEEKITLRRSVIENPDFADLVAKALVDSDSLSPGERIRVNLACANAIEHLQQAFLLRNEGLVDWESQEQILRGYLAQELFRGWWGTGRVLLKPEFVKHIETEILPSAEDESLYWKP